MAILSIEIKPYFDGAGALEKIKASIETDDVGRVAVVLTRSDVDLALDANGDLSAKAAVLSALRTKARALIAAKRAEEQAEASKQAADAVRRAKISLNVAPADL